MKILEKLSALRGDLRKHKTPPSHADQIEAMMSASMSAALRVEEILSGFPTDPEFQQYALSMRRSIFHQYEAASRDFIPYWTLPLPKARLNAPIDAFFCVAPMGWK